MTRYDPDAATFVPYVPAAYGKTPTTSSEVLEAAACVLEEEGRWAQSLWYQHHDPTLEEYVDNPYCNGWSVCADGALQVVSMGAYRVNEWRTGWFLSGLSPAYAANDEGVERYRLYADAVDLVEDHLSASSGRLRALTSFNDEWQTTRGDVVAAMRGAAELGRKREAEAA